jgi:hypothetical protein
MTTFERALVTQQIGFNRGECASRGDNDTIIAHTLPPFETYMRQLDIAAALCVSGKDGGPDLGLARRLADGLFAIAPGDPWVLLIGARVDETRMSSAAAADKRRQVVERWRQADDNLPLVRAVRALVDEQPEQPTPEPSPSTELSPMSPAVTPADELTTEADG